MPTPNQDAAIILLKLLAIKTSDTPEETITKFLSSKDAQKVPPEILDVVKQVSENTNVLYELVKTVNSARAKGEISPTTAYNANQAIPEKALPLLNRVTGTIENYFPTPEPEIKSELYELAARTFGFDPKDRKNRMQLNFDDDATGISLGKTAKAGLIFKDGNYSLAGHQDLSQGMEILGQQLIDQAAKEGKNIATLPEFKGVDLDRNGEVDAKEVGAMLLAASMYNVSGQMGEIRSHFDNALKREEMVRMLDPNVAEATKLIAKQLLQDNGVQMSANQTDEKFVQAIGETKGIGQGRC